MTSTSDLAIIASNPIRDGLDPIKLRISEGRAMSRDWEAADFDHKTLIYELIYALQTLPAARNLHSRNEVGTLRDDLRKLSFKLDLQNFIPLLEHIIKGSDLDIWEEVFALVEQNTPIIPSKPYTPPEFSKLVNFGTTVRSNASSQRGDEQKHSDIDRRMLEETPTIPSKPNTPPKVSKLVNFGTPVKSNASSQRGDEQKHSDIDHRMLEEIRDCTYNNTKGFYEKYFEGRPWLTKAEEIVKLENPQKKDNRWSDYPDPPPDQKNFLEWLRIFQQKFFWGHRGRYYQSKDVPLGSSDCNRKPDLFLAHPTKSGKKYEWPDVRVIGELKKTENSGEYRKELVLFSELAREIFISQPTRLFLHGFIIRGPTVELLVYDRSGPYSCERFNLHDEPEKFIKVMAGYTLMSDEDLGLNTYIKQDASGTYIKFKDEGMTAEERFDLENQPIASQHSIVCRGTTCHRAKTPGSKDWKFVVKFSWRSDKRQAEGKLLKLAKERGVWGVAQVFGYQDLDSISHLRFGMEFENRMRFPSTRLISHAQSRTTSDHSKSTQSKSTSLSFRSLLPDSLSGKKRKQDSKVAGARYSKRLRLNGKSRLVDLSAQTNWEQDGVAESASKRPVVETKPGSLMPHTNAKNQSFESRIFSCLVVSPPGRAIHKFESVLELLEAFRDFIKGHKSLVQDGNILHRDISVNNLIITDAEDENDPKGLLIDLDLAKGLGSGPSGARHRTGTTEFMAIEILQGTTHTYRHDLESFFYVFLWVIIRYGQEKNNGLPRDSILRDWYTGTYHQIAFTKLGHMASFEFIVAEFPPMFEDVKELAKELRNILFGTEGGGLFIGTYEGQNECNKMYNAMINAFNGAIKMHRRKVGEWEDEEVG